MTDAGYKIIILLSGITNSLRKQTQERIDENFMESSGKKRDIIGGNWILCALAKKKDHRHSPTE